MTPWSRIRSWLRAVVRRSRMESEMDVELRFHIEAFAEDLVRSGMSREEAVRRGRIEFGAVERAKEECREARGVSLAIVRLILGPVILLAVYHLFAMGWIVDRIVNVDAPATTLSEQVSVEMLEARRAERNYLLLRDAAYVEANRASIAKARETLIEIQNLAPSEQEDAQKALDELLLYRQRFEAAVSILRAPGQAATDRIQAAVHAYENDLNGLLTQARFWKREQLVDELRNRVDSFDKQISKTVQERDPELRQATVDLENSSQEILRRASELESRSWKRVQEDHRQARHLINQAEWTLSVVSPLPFCSAYGSVSACRVRL